MKEDFVNRYVIKQNGSHRWTHFHIISTLSGYNEMLRALQATIGGLEYQSSKDPQFKIPGRQIWGANATLATGRTSFIYLSFDIEPDLASYHEKRFWRRSWIEYVLLLIFAVILVLAGIGAISVLRAIFS
jgi:hypothetical protein